MANPPIELKMFLEDRDDPPQVFLCHSSDDKKFVTKLAKDVTSLGIRVWFDEWRLEVGDSLHEVIGKALERSAFIAVVLSPSSIESTWCKAELDQALTREKREGRKIALPLLYRRVKPPPFLEGRLYLNFSHLYLHSLARLCGFVRGYKVDQINTKLKAQKPKTVGDVAIVLNECSPLSRVNVLPAEKYMALKKMLEETGVDVGRQMFSVADHADPHTMILQVDEYWVKDRATLADTVPLKDKSTKSEPPDSTRTK